MPRRAWLRLAVALLGIACGEGCARAREERLDLIAALVDAERRSDAVALPELASEPRFGKRGFGPLEPSGVVWTMGNRARVSLPFYSSDGKELRVRVRCHESLGPALPLTVSLNERPLATWTLTPFEQELRLALPSDAQVPGDNLLSFDAPRQRRPAPGEPDQRALVAAFSQLEVRPLGWPALAPATRHSEAGLLLSGRSALAYHIDIAEQARLRIAAARAAELRVSIQDDDEAESLLSGRFPSGGTRSLGLERWERRLVRLEIANPGSEPAALSTLEIAWPGAPAGPAAAGPALGYAPNIVLYLVDTLRADRLGAYGHRAPTSPRFDAFASEALLIEDAWAQASWTRPAVGSIFTGLYPAGHGADREDRALAPEAATIAESLDRLGYRTGAFVANHLVGGRFGFDQGFDAWNDGDEHLYGAAAATLGQRALAWLDRGSGPFFLYLHTMEPHSPYQPAPEHAAPFALETYAGERDSTALLRMGQLGTLPAEGLRYLEALYQGEVRQNDAAFGALLDGLRSRGLLDRTLVVFTADHGEELLEHGGTEHAKTVYQELLRVPLAVRLPGARGAGAREPAPVQQIDLYPTLLRFAGAPAPADLPGRDLAERWLGAGKPAPRDALLLADQRFTVTAKSAARRGRYKLILNADGPALWRAGSRLELYDLRHDPAERSNLAESRPIAARCLERELLRFRAAQAAARKGRELTLSPREREQLRALGYVQ